MIVTYSVFLLTTNFNSNSPSKVKNHKIVILPFKPKWLNNTLLCCMLTVKRVKTEFQYLQGFDAGLNLLAKTLVRSCLMRFISELEVKWYRYQNNPLDFGMPFMYPFISFIICYTSAEFPWKRIKCFTYYAAIYWKLFKIIFEEGKTNQNE